MSAYNRPQQIVRIAVDELRPYEGNPRINDSTVPHLVESIRRLGFRNPLYVAPDMTIIAGHTRLKAAQALGMTEVDCIIVSDLTEAEVREMRISDNRLAEFAKWDLDLLRDEVEWLEDDGADLEYLDLDEMVDMDEGIADDLFGILPGDSVEVDRTIYDSFSVTLVIPIQHKELVHEWIKDHGKDELTRAVVDHIQGGGT